MNRLEQENNANLKELVRVVKDLKMELMVTNRFLKRLNKRKEAEDLPVTFKVVLPEPNTMLRDTDLPVRTANRLYDYFGSYDIEVEQLDGISISKFRKVRGVGNGVIEELRDFMNANQLVWQR